MNDIPINAFVMLRKHFFDDDMKPTDFFLRQKKNTQDDPLDEYMANNVLSNLDVECERSGPLVSPDIVLYDADKLDMNKLDNIEHIVAIELKRVSRAKNGAISRASSIDYNSTPPCGKVRVYADNKPLDIRSFYLFMCSENPYGDTARTTLTALALVDGNLLNEDFKFYLNITGERKKKIGLGSFGDGLDRTRPMLTFPNPLSISGFDGAATLVHPNPELEELGFGLKMTNIIERVRADGTVSSFYCYRLSGDVNQEKVVWLGDPFDIPNNRDTKTRQRGKFNISL